MFTFVRPTTTKISFFIFKLIGIIHISIKTKLANLS